MAWIYLVVLGDSPWPWLPGSDQSPIVKTIDTASQCLCPICNDFSYPSPQYGMTCELCAETIFQEKSTSFTEDFRARISALRELEEAWEASEADLLSKSSDLSKSFAHLSSSLKTSLRLGQEDLDVWSQPWPASGMTVDGRLFRPQSLAPRTCVKDGSYLPTPCARDYRSPGASRTRKKNLEERRGIPLSQYFKMTFGKRLHPTFVEWMMGFPLKHTVLSPSVMQWYRTKQEKHSKD